MQPRPDSLQDTILVTHENCMDGAGCAIMYLVAGGSPKNIRYVPAGMLERFIKDSPEFAEGSKLMIFADIGTTQPKYADLIEKRGNAVLLDHHATSMHMKGRDWALVDGSTCGTEHLRRWLGVDRVNWFVLASIINDHDSWLNKDPRSKTLITLFTFYGQRRFVQEFVDRDVQHDICNQFEKTLLPILETNKHKEIAENIRSMIVRDLGVNGTTYKVGYVVSGCGHISDLLQEMLEKHPEIDISCQISFDRGAVSLRSRDHGKDINVAEIAKSFGGGGHPGAAGHRIEKEEVLAVIEEIHG